MSAINIYLILLTCIAFYGHVESKELSKGMYNLLSNVNGIWSNREQVKDNKTDHHFIEIKNFPVKIPALGDVPAVFIDYNVHGKRRLLNVAVLSEDDKNVMYFDTYTLKNVSGFEPGAYNVTDIENLSNDHLQADNDCTATIEPVNSGVFFAAWPSCSVIIDGKRPVYSLTFGCDTFTVIYPLSVTEKPTRTPYVFKRDAEGLPIPDAPKDIIRSCKEPFRTKPPTRPG